MSQEIYQILNYQLPEVNKVAAQNPAKAAKKFYTAIYQSIYSIPQKIVFQDSQLKQYEFRGRLKKQQKGGASPYYNFQYEEYFNYQPPEKDADTSDNN